MFNQNVPLYSMGGDLYLSVNAMSSFNFVA